VVSFTLGLRDPDIYCFGGWVVLRASIDAVVKRKNPITDPSRIWTPPVQPIA